MHRTILFGLALVFWALAGLAPLAFAQSTHRLYDGITTFVHNEEGGDFTVRLSVRDLNLFETGPREVLVKVYDPEGHALVRKSIADDGVVSRAFLPPLGAWDHEAWYYAHCYQKGTQPMFRWSAFSEPDRLGSLAKREFSFPIKGGKKGTYRVLVVGAIDHYVTLQFDPNLPHAIAGQPDWLHGHGQQWRKAFVYVPRGGNGLFCTLAEYDQPRQRRVVVRAPDGKELLASKAGQIFWKDQLVSSGAVRDTPLRCRRSFTFADEEVACSVQLDETSDSDLLNLWLKHPLRGKVREAYEMIPYLPNQRPRPGAKKGETIVSVIDALGKVLKPLGQEPVEAAGILIDRGGFGVRIFLDRPRPVLRGTGPVVLIRLADRVVPAKEAALSYRLVPFGN